MPDTGSDNGRNELFVSLDRIEMIWYLASTISFALAGMVLYIYYLRKGQFDDPEDVKYQMFRDEDSE